MYYHQTGLTAVIITLLLTFMMALFENTPRIIFHSIALTFLLLVEIEEYILLKHSASLF